MPRRAGKKASLAHLDQKGEAHVVDVGGKPNTRRTAEARARVTITVEAARAILEGEVAKGDVGAVARIAAIQAAKRTSELIPLCHPLGLTHVAADLAVDPEGVVELRVRAECFGPTGVEMEAMTGAAVGALAIYDMIKGIDRRATIVEVALISKSGGRSGDFRR